MKDYDFPFDIRDIAFLLNLRIVREPLNTVYIYTECPFCGDKRGKMNLNFEKNVYRCNYCGEYGGMLEMYARFYKISTSDAYREVCEALNTGNRPQGYDDRKAAPKQSSVKTSQLADIDVIHQTLSLLFDMLALFDKHRVKLLSRGLTDTQIKKLGYKSTPLYFQCESLTERLINQGCTVEGVPGFYLGDNGKWTVKFNTKTAGMLIPVRGIDGLIRGAQIRLDIPIKDENDDPDKEGTKYLWLSSSNKNMGVTSGSPVHFVGDPFAKTIYVTEGSLKADIAHCLMNRSFVAIAGANNLGQLDPVFSVLAHNGTNMIIEAHDIDKYRNKMIHSGAAKIYGMAQKYGMESKRLTWDPNYKGIDDWQFAVKNKSVNEACCKLNFKEQFLFGLCAIGKISDCIGEWNDITGTKQSLPDYLGLTEHEYNIYCSNVRELEIFLLEQQKQQRFRIYQLEFDDENNPIPFAFAGIKALQKAGYEQPPASEYRLISDSGFLCGKMLSVRNILNWIYNKYNDYRLPDDYHGRKIAPSDIIELYDNEKRRYFYRDKENFVEVKFSPMLAMPMKAKAQ